MLQMFNSEGQSPCLIASYLNSACLTDPSQAFVFSLPAGFVYRPPTADTATDCQCSSVVYSLLQACSICQGGASAQYSVWNTNCSNVFLTIFPEDIPADTAVPAWAYLDVSTSDTFNPAVAEQFEQTGAPESTSAPSSTSTPHHSHQSGSSSGVSGGAIAGIVIGVVVGVAAIAFLAFWFYRRRKNTSRGAVVAPAEPYTNAKSAKSSASTSLITSPTPTPPLATPPLALPPSVPPQAAISSSPKSPQPESFPAKSPAKSPPAKAPTKSPPAKAPAKSPPARAPPAKASPAKSLLSKLPMAQAPLARPPSAQIPPANTPLRTPPPRPVRNPSVDITPSSMSQYPQPAQSLVPDPLPASVPLPVSPPATSSPRTLYEYSQPSPRPRSTLSMSPPSALSPPMPGTPASESPSMRYVTPAVSSLPHAGVPRIYEYQDTPSDLGPYPSSISSPLNMAQFDLPFRPSPFQQVPSSPSYMSADGFQQRSSGQYQSGD
ncbi:hypothetical protein C8Q75DRAFT_810059 [Abortiporus biennis]|nr:hypothetical protein C8Q75DRAFT_810059 [Abortiporus biennis]